MNSCDRYAPAMSLFFVGLIAMALDFATVVLSGGSPITPEVYGPAVYAFPAWAWITLQMTACGAGAIGVLLSGKLRASAFVIGSLLTLILFSAFAIMAQGAPQGSVLAAGARSFVGSILCVIFLVGVSGLKDD